MSNTPIIYGGSNEIYCAECYDSPTSTWGKTSTSKTHLRCVNVGSEYNAYMLARRWLTAYRSTYQGLVLDAIETVPIEGTASWDIHATYKIYQWDVNVILDYKFSTTGGSAHIDRSLNTNVNWSCVPGLPALLQNGAIGVNAGGEKEGVDVKRPAFSWQQTQAFSLDMVNTSFKKMLANYTACINSRPFRGFAAGEVLFDGVSDGSLITDYDKETNAPYQYYKLTFSFAAMPNLFNQRVGGSPTFIKYGWDYQWVLWEKITDNGSVVQRPRNVYVEQVYPDVDLNDLGLVKISL